MLPLVLLGLFTFVSLAIVNGANDVGKSVASLLGSSQSTESKDFGRMIRTAVLWGGLFSGLGSIVAIYVSGRLFLIFTQDLVHFPLDTSFALAVLVGATSVIVVGTVFSLPISSTHAIVGSITFELIHLFGIANIDWDILVLRVLLPMAGSPFVALVLTYVLDRLGRNHPVANNLRPNRARILHWGSAAANSTARGMNDAPKIAALGFLLLPITSSLWILYGLVGVMMVLGAVVFGRHVTMTVMEMRTDVDIDKRLRAGLTTAALVSVGAVLGAPLSSTHVGAAADVGVRTEKREVFWTSLGSIFLGWIITFPLAGVVSVGASFLIHG